MAEFVHWCGNCQIRIYVERHYGKRLDWTDCPYTCEYATAMRCRIEQEGEQYMRGEQDETDKRRTIT